MKLSHFTTVHYCSLVKEHPPPNFGSVFGIGLLKSVSTSSTKLHQEIKTTSQFKFVEMVETQAVVSPLIPFLTKLSV